MKYICKNNYQKRFYKCDVIPEYYYYYVFKGNFKPVRVTLTASKGDEVKLIMDVVETERRDITWKFNGQYIFNRVLYDFARCMSKVHVCSILCMQI